MLHIYHGNGKGKTTSVIGLAVRYAGAGGKVLFMQFLKNGTSSEISLLKNIEGIKVICCESCNKFTFHMNDDEKNAVIQEHNKMLVTAKAFIEENSECLVIMDELLDAYNKSMLDKTVCDEMILSLSDKTEIALTGRSPNEKFVEKADYVSRIEAEKHPYEKGIAARKGIEY